MCKHFIFSIPAPVVKIRNTNSKKKLHWGVFWKSHKAIQFAFEKYLQMKWNTNTGKRSWLTSWYSMDMVHGTYLPYQERWKVRPVIEQNEYIFLLNLNFATQMSGGQSVINSKFCILIKHDIKKWFVMCYPGSVSDDI